MLASEPCRLPACLKKNQLITYNIRSHYQQMRTKPLQHTRSQYHVSTPILNTVPKLKAEMIRHLAKLNHVQFAISHVRVMFAYQLADFMSRKFNVDNFQSLLQLTHTNEATPISINLTHTHTSLSAIIIIFYPR